MTRALVGLAVVLLLGLAGAAPGHAEKRVTPHRAEAARRLVDLELGPQPGTQTAAVAPPVAPSVPPVPAAPPVLPADPCAGPVTALFALRCGAPLSGAQERGLKPKDSFRECANCPEMVVVPAGSFMMGSPENEEQRNNSEGPQHRVTIAKPFAVGRFAVTFDEWDACVAAGGCNGYIPPDQGWGRGRRPVINVSWNDAKAYVAWLSGTTEKSYRLLSEAEREYVARAGTETPFWWGSSITTQDANYNGNYTYAGGAKGEYQQRTLAVESFQPNPWRLYQVHGNVWEWVEDCWHDSYAGAPADGTAFTAVDCRVHVVRGGSWFNVPRLLRAAFRLGNVNRGNRFGFRVGRTLTP